MTKESPSPEANSESLHDEPTNDARQEIRERILACRWQDLVPHHKRGGLLWVRADLDLVEAAHALANDRTDRIEVWLAVGRMGRSDETFLQQMRDRDPRIQFVIVQPWVVAQPIEMQSR